MVPKQFCSFVRKLFPSKGLVHADPYSKPYPCTRLISSKQHKSAKCGSAFVYSTGRNKNSLAVIFGELDKLMHVKMLLFQLKLGTCMCMSGDSEFLIPQILNLIKKLCTCKHS